MKIDVWRSVQESALATLLAIACAGCGSSGNGATASQGPATARIALECATLAAQPALNTGQYLLDLAGSTCAIPTLRLSQRAQLTAQNGTLKIGGDIRLSDSAALTIETGTLSINNQTNCQYNIYGADNSVLSIDHSSVVTNGLGTGNICTNYLGSGSATLNVQYSTLDSTSSWFLAQMTENSKLTVQNSELPTEIYVNDSSNVSVSDDQVAGNPRAQNGLWLNFPAGSGGTLALPDTAGPYTWDVGASSGLTGISWNLQVENAQAGIGVEPHAGANLTVVGQDLSTKEINMSIWIDPACGTAIANALGTTPATPYVLENLPLDRIDAAHGFANDTYAMPLLPGTGSPLLTLMHVNVGAFAWQIYAGNGAACTSGPSQGKPPPVTVSLLSGAFNEIAAVNGGTMNLSGTTLQLAVMQAIGGGVINVLANSDVWSQTIQGSSGGQINFIDASLHGSALVATGGGKVEFDANTVLWANGETSTSLCDFDANYAWMESHSGRPQCNPFNVAAAFSSRTTDSDAGSLIEMPTAHAACSTEGANYSPAILFETYPANGDMRCLASGAATVTGTAPSSGPALLGGLQASTAYACTITAPSATTTYNVTTSACAY